MPLVTDARQDIDSLCHACLNDHDRENVSADGWVAIPDGVRRYYCEGHLMDLCRFDADPEGIEDHPLARPCRDCNLLTLVTDTDGFQCCPDCQA